MKVKHIAKSFRVGKNEKELLKMIGIGIFFTASFAIPNLPLAIKPFLTNKRRREKAFKKLEEKGLIILGGEKIVLSPRGEEIQRRSMTDDLVIEHFEWDGIWRVVIYDIPNTDKKERDYFRLILKKLGFTAIQKSTWVIPWECKEEIAIAAQNLRLSPYIMYLTTDHLPNQKSMEKSFGLNDEE